MKTEALSPLELVNLRLKALEIAERCVSQPYISGGGYRDKDCQEIISRAERFFRFALDDSGCDTPSNLIKKLKTVLCSAEQS